MSIWQRLWGAGGAQTALSEPLRLDLARLKKVVARIGDTRLALKLVGLRSDPDEQLREINHFLGGQLEGSAPKARYERAAAFPPADDVLPPKVKETVARPPAAASDVRDVGCADLGRIHRQVLDVMAAAPDRATDARAPVIMVINVRDAEGRTTPLHWEEPCDWKACAVIFRLHELDHLGQIRRLLRS